MKAQRILGITVSILVVVALGFYWPLHRSFSYAIRTKGPILCHLSHPCVFTLDRIFPGTWDRIIVFDMAAGQDEIDAAVGKHVSKPDLERLIVFMQGPDVYRTIVESQGIERPTLDEVVIDGVAQTQNHVVIKRIDEFVMAGSSDSCSHCSVLSLVKPGDGLL